MLDIAKYESSDPKCSILRKLADGTVWLETGFVFVLIEHNQTG